MIQTGIDPATLRKDFPILQRSVNGKPLVYLDNAATAQKPQRVLDAVNNYYKHHNANIHRGVHTLSVEATDLFEAARETARAFINAERHEELVCVRGATEAMNLVAQAYGRPRLQPGDEILITHMEHHSNIVPWQLLCEQTGAKLVVAPINDRGELDVNAFEQLLTPKTKIVSVIHVSNALGTINPVKQLATMTRANAADAVFMVDGAQAIPHMRVDVRDIDCDFYAISSHKAFGPTGTGMLYGKHAVLEAMDPYQGGGEMILSVSFEKTEYNKVPHKFEAGTPDIAGVVGFGEALRYLADIGMDRIDAAEQELLAYATDAVSAVDGVRIIGTAEHKAGVISFVMDGVHPHDIGTILDQHAVAVRTGHHCAQPVMDRFDIPATVRASLAFYNTRDDIDRLVESLTTVAEVFR